MLPIPPELSKLVFRFKANSDDYKKASFNETQLRREFLDVFFEYLGWDVSNKKGYAESFKEVIHEDRLKDEGHRKAPDYSFRVGRERIFFVEAKKPSVLLGKDKSSAYQLRRYAWSAGLPLSVLSNFEELSIYDTRIKPEISDTPLISLILNVNYLDYEKEWAGIANIISREAVYTGSFERFAKSKTRKGASPVDKDFLDALEMARKTLASAVFRHNHSLSVDELSYVVHATLDRILFLRIAEDKGIEQYGKLEKVIGKGSYTKALRQFEDAQKRYNSGLFHTSPENKSDKGFDEISSSIKIPDDTFNELIRSFYYPASPYEFSVISPEILGSVYERFLGSRIAIDGSKVSVDLKEDIKKAGGVYYTPPFITKYMTAASLIPAIRLPPDELPKVRVLDMACGSGSFLIEVYDALLIWFRDWHIARGDKSARYLHVSSTKDGAERLRLTFNERKRILLEHIFGVDIDREAVEVTKLSLFLKLIEDTAVLPAQLELASFQKRLLPSLEGNIKTGNSIVGEDISDFASLTLENFANFKPFAWNDKHNFRQIIEQGGFDLIIGNPPYSYRKSTVELFRDYYKAKYNGSQGNLDIYKMFLEKPIELLRSGGVVCQIVNSSFLIQPQFIKLRTVLDAGYVIDEIDVLGPNVFEDVTIDTAVFRGRKRGRGFSNGMIKIKEPALPALISKTESTDISQSRLKLRAGREIEWRLSDKMDSIVKALMDNCSPLASYFDVSVGINTGYIKKEMSSRSKLDKRYHSCVPGTGITRYGEVETDGFIMYDPVFIRDAGSRGRSLPEERFFDQEKLLVVRTRNTSLKRRVVATLDMNNCYHLNRLSSVIAKNGSSLLTLLGFICSEFANYLFLTKFFNYEIKPVFLSKMPLPLASDQKIDCLVSERLELGRSLGSALSPSKREATVKKCHAVEVEIDRLVYAHFDISKDVVTTIKDHITKLPGK